MNIHFPPIGSNLFRIVLFVFNLSLLSGLVKANADGKAYSSPPVFTENKGQIVDTKGRLRPDLLYVFRSGGLDIYFAKDRIYYAPKRLYSSAVSQEGTAVSAFSESDLRMDYCRVEAVFLKANPDVVIRSEKKSNAYSNYYYSHCPQGITHVNSYEQLIYENMYPGIDLVFKTEAGKIKYDIIIRPGADPEDIQIAYAGAEKILINRQGELEIRTALGVIKEKIPMTYQQTSAGRNSLKGKYSLSHNKLGFKVPAYDPAQTLVIDPLPWWVTYLGGDAEDEVNDVATDGNNNVIAVGSTRSSNFPDANTTFSSGDAGVRDAFVTKFYENGSLWWSAYYGGNSSDRAYAIAVNGTNQIGFTGVTDDASTFPMIPGSPPSTPGTGGFSDGYLVMLNNDGTGAWSIYYGGNEDDEEYGIVFTPADDIILTGISQSTNLPAPCPNPDFLKKTPGINSDIDVTITQIEGTDLLTYGTVTFSGYLGGTGFDLNPRVKLDPAGNLIVMAKTESTDVDGITLPGGNKGLDDIMLMRIAPDCSGINWGRYFGGKSAEYPVDLAVDATGIVVTGSTVSGASVPPFPTTPNTLYPAPPVGGNNGNMFITKFTLLGDTVWSTYFGSPGGITAGTGVEIAGNGDICLTGSTTSAQFPVTPAAMDTTYNGGEDAFFSRISTDGDRIICGTYLGGTLNDLPAAIAINKNTEDVILGGSTEGGFPTVNAYYPNYGGGATDGFVAKVCSHCGPAIAVIINKDSIIYPDSVFICSGDSLFLLSQKQGLISWTTLPASSTWTTDSIWVKPAVTTSYILQLDGGSCPAADTLTVVVGGFISNPVVNPDTVCQGDSVSLIAGGSGPKYRWFRDNLGTDTLVWDSSLFESGPLMNDTVFYVQAYSASGCVSKIDSVKIKVDMPPVVTIAGNQTICKGDSLILTANGGNTYVWTDTLGNILSNADTVKIIPPAGITKYYVSVVKGTCTILDSVFTTVDTIPAIAINGSPMITVCSGDTVMLIATGGTTYIWSTGETNDTIYVNNVVTPAVLWVDGTKGACTARDSITITISTNLSDPGIKGDTVICSGDSTVIAATFIAGGYEYTWYSDAAGMNSIGKDSIFVTPVLFSDTVFYIQVSKGACESSIRPVQIIVNPLPVPGVTGLTTICRGDSTTLTATGGIGYVWTWTGGTANTASITVSPVNTTLYTVSVMNSDSCYADTSVTVVTNPTPQPNAGPDRTLCRGDAVMIGTPGNAAAVYSWSPAGGLDNPSIAQPTASPAVTTTYILTVTDNSCSDWDTVLLTVDSCFEYVSYVYVPSAFTQKGSGTTWVIQYNNLDKYNLKVFNRWGELLFETDKPEVMWDGKSNGKEVETGAYVYVIKAIGLDAKEHNLAGTVSILK